MKLGWGKRILILYLGFVTLILTLVYFSFKQDVNLVRVDYYEQEKLYNLKYQGQENVKAMGKSPYLEIGEDSVRLYLPALDSMAEMSGLVQFFRPSTSQLDIKDSFAIQLPQHLSYKRSLFAEGKYYLWISWFCDSVYYYNEQVFDIK